MTESNGKTGAGATADWRQSRPKRMKILLASAGGSLLMRSLGVTLRLHAHPHKAVAKHRRDGGGLIFAMFHGPHFPVLWSYRNHGLCVITSRSADGEILTRIMTSFGYTAVRGSSSRGGTRALVDLARLVSAGRDTGIAVDGPRGPRLIVKPGVVLLAKLTNCMIIPIGSSLDRYWQINSWDRYRIPKPGARALVVCGDPIDVPADADDDLIEHLRGQLEHRMIELQNRTDEAVKSKPSALALLAECVGDTHSV